MNYTGVFEDLLAVYTILCELFHAKITNLESLLLLTGNLTLQNASREKERNNKPRYRNSNLEITISSQETTIADL